MDGGFSLSWEREDNSSCDYVVEWYDAYCRKDCPLDWTKVAAPNNFSVESGMAACIPTKDCVLLSPCVTLLHIYVMYTTE